MANEQNLVPFTSDQDREEASKNGKKGGVASGEARRRKRTFRELINQVLSMDVVDQDIKDMLKKHDLDNSHDAAIILAAIRKAESGDIESARFLRDTRGEKPTEQYNLGITGKPVKSLDLSQLSDEELEALADQAD